MTQINMIKAARLDIKLYLGDTWSQVFEFVNALDDPIDITGIDFTLQLKVQNTDVTAVKELSILNGALSITAPNKLNIYSDTSDLLHGCYKYDLQGTESGLIKTFCFGNVILQQDTTR